MLTTKHPGRLSALALVIGLLAGCESGPQIVAQTDPTANLSSYKTYGFAAQPGTNRGGNATPLTTYFETSIAKQMDARGYKKVDSNPDLLVNFNANVQEKADIQSTPSMGVGYYGYRGGMYGGYGGSEVNTVRYKYGTANIDVVDAAKKRIVWEGRAEGELTSAAMQNPAGSIDKVVADMYSRFPVTPAATPTP